MHHRPEQLGKALVFYEVDVFQLPDQQVSLPLEIAAQSIRVKAGRIDIVFKRVKPFTELCKLFLAPLGSHQEILAHSAHAGVETCENMQQFVPRLGKKHADEHIETLTVQAVLPSVQNPTGNTGQEG